MFLIYEVTRGLLGSHLMGILGEACSSTSLSDSSCVMRSMRCSPWQQLLAGRHAADLCSVLAPGLEVLQGVQGAVLQTQWVRGHRLVDGLLEGLLLQLHEDAVGLLPLRLALLCRLPPAATRREPHEVCTSQPDPFKTEETV